MGCLKGKLKNKPEKGNFRCRKCGGCSKKKSDICKPELISDSPADKSTKDKPDKKKKKGKNK